MKTSVVAILVSGAIAASSIMASCAMPGSQPAVIKAPSLAPGRPLSAVVASATAAERLDQIQQSTQMLINQYLLSGQEIPDYMHDMTQALEKAKRDLFELEGQRAGLQMLAAQHVAAGEPIPDSEYELAQSIERSIRQVLKSVGLED